MNEHLTVPWVESPFFKTLLRERKPTPEQESTARQYRERGYVVLDNLITADEAQQIIREAAPLYVDGKDGARTRVRVQDGWHESPAVARLAAHPRVLEMLQFLYGRRPLPFQTLNFPQGSQQAGHSDQIHFSSLPARFMCGVWVALEDIGPDNGPLFYYPGSHRLPEYDYYDLGVSAEPPDYDAYERAVAEMMKEHGFPREELHVKAGTALIWSSNIVHGGTPIRRTGATRHSQVTHYYFDDCVYYTPMHSCRPLGEYELREHVIDIRTGEELRQTWNGRPFVAVRTANGRKRIEVIDARTGFIERKVRSIVNRNGLVGRALKASWHAVKTLRRAPGGPE